MFKTYRHAELGSPVSSGGGSARYWHFVELELYHPWFYMELVRDHGDDIVGRMLLIPTVPILKQMLSELDDRSWFAQAYLVIPGHMRGAIDWVMEPLKEVSIAEDASTAMEGYMYEVARGARYSIHHEHPYDNLSVTEIIFSAERDLRIRG